MKIKKKSYFKDEINDPKQFNKWVSKLELLNGRHYERIVVKTSLGTTHVWGLNTHDTNLETLVIFPGARTTSLIWDFDRGLDNLGGNLRIFMIETNGLPNLSSGQTPDIKSNDYGIWANEVLDQLAINKAFVAGASFGGLIAMKLGSVAPERIKAAFLLNPGCLQPFSLEFRNLYYNLLPIIRPTDKNVRKFLDEAIFEKPNHQLSIAAENMLVEYEVFALNRYKDNTQKPYFMKKELLNIRVNTYLLEGDKDLLFPYKKSIENARKYLKAIKEIKILENVGHGIETHPAAISYIGNTIQALSGKHTSLPT
jgi:pimeloyl-ACP methyl ester carboxylesterase